MGSHQHLVTQFGSPAEPAWGPSPKLVNLPLKYKQEGPVDRKCRICCHSCDVPYSPLSRWDEMTQTQHCSFSQYLGFCGPLCANSVRWSLYNLMCLKIISGCDT